MDQKVHIENSRKKYSTEQDYELQVYDLTHKCFKKINTNKRNECKAPAVVILDYNSITMLEQYFLMCGYVIIDKAKHMIIPVDILADHICIFESHYNMFFAQCSFELSQYNVTKKPDDLFSRFFLQNQFLHDDKCYEENGSFIKLCSMILNNSQTIKKLVNKRISLYQPNTYDELCTMVQRITKLSGINWWELDYLEKYKYLLDSLINRYSIKLTDDEIWAVWNQVCGEILKHWEDI